MATEQTTGAPPIGELTLTLTADEQRKADYDEQHRQHNADELHAARATATTGKGEPASAPVNQRYRPEPVPKQATPGLRVEKGPIAGTKYAPPLDLDPRIVEALEGFEDHKGYLAPTQTAFSTAFEGLQKIAEGRTQAAKNQAWNDFQQLLQVGGFAEKMHERINKAFDAATRSLIGGIEVCEKELRAPLEASASSALSKEIRDHVKGLPEKERGEFLATAVRNNDMTVINALLGFPHYLSGVSKTAHDLYTFQFRKAQKPELVGRQAAMRAALALVDQRAPRLHTQVESAMGGKFATLKRVREASSAAEKALAFEQSNNPLMQ